MSSPRPAPIGCDPDPHRPRRGEDHHRIPPRRIDVAAHRRSAGGGRRRVPSPGDAGPDRKITLAVEDLAELTELPAADLTTVVDRLAAPDLHILRRVTAPESTTLVRADLPRRPRPSDQRLASSLHRARRDHELLEAKVETERIQKEQAQAESEIATERAAHERKRRKRAVMGLVVAVSALVVTLIGGLLYAVNESRRTAPGPRRRRAGSNRRDGEPELSVVGHRSGRDRVAGSLTHVRSPHQCLDRAASERGVAGPRNRSRAPRELGDLSRRRRSRVGWIRRHRPDVGSAWEDITPDGFNDQGDDDPAVALAVAEHDGRSLLLIGRSKGQVDVRDVTDPEPAQPSSGASGGAAGPRITSSAIPRAMAPHDTTDEASDTRDR